MQPRAIAIMQALAMPLAPRDTPQQPLMSRVMLVMPTLMQMPHLQLFLNTA